MKLLTLGSTVASLACSVILMTAQASLAETITVRGELVDLVNFTSRGAAQGMPAFVPGPSAQATPHSHVHGTTDAASTAPPTSMPQSPVMSSGGGMSMSNGMPKPNGMPASPMPMASATMGSPGTMPMQSMQSMQTMGPEMMTAMMPMMMTMMAMHHCGTLAIVGTNGKSYVIVSKTPRSQPVLCASVGKTARVTGELYERSGLSLIVADSIEVGL